MEEKLYEKKNYTVQIPFLFNTYIREYDISKANINILLWKGIIDKETYDKLYHSTREVRQYSIGMLLRNNEEYKKILEDGFSECRRMFIEANHLDEKDILSIKNDAFFIINKIPKIRQFHNIYFREGSIYTSFMGLNKNRLELYYKPAKIGEDSSIEVKGISDTKLKLHKSHFMDFLLYVFDVLENGDLAQLISSVKIFYEQYINRQLDINFYREFNAESCYKLCYHINGSMRVMCIDNDIDAYRNISCIDITYNMSIIREIFRYIGSLYFNNKTTR